MGTGNPVPAELRQSAAPGKGLLKRYVSKATGMSRAQATRLIAQHVASLNGRGTAGERKAFTASYTPDDIKLLRRWTRRIKP